MTFRRHIPSLAIFAAFLGVFFWGLSQGMLGHDYFYFFPKLLDGKWHVMRQGIAPFLYTPHFCGGIPVFGNPQDLFYSLPQLLSLFLDLWVAVRLSILTAMIAGYIGWYRFGRDVLKLDLPWAHVLSLTIIAHGFYFLHMIAGHVPFFSMPLLGWLLWLLFEPKTERWKELFKRAAWCGLLVGFMMYSGAYMGLLMGLMAVLAMLPIDLLISGAELRSRITTLVSRFLALGISALFVSLAKIIAVMSFLRHFPREWPFERFPEGSSVLMYMLKAFFALPQNDDLFWAYGMPDWGAVHEYSLLLSPVVLVGCVVGAWLLIYNRRTLQQHPIETLLALLWVQVLLFFFMAFTRGYGFFITPLQELPILSSLHVTTRFLYPFSFLLIGLSIFALSRLMGIPKLQGRSHHYAIAAGVITVIAFITGYAGLLSGETLPRTMPYLVILDAFKEHPDFLKKNVTEAYDMRGMGHSGFVPLLFGGSEIYCHEPMFLGSSSMQDNIVAGPVAEIRDGAFNLRNPACMLYPKENNCAPGDRILESDRGNFEKFVAGEKTTWKISVIQYIANWASIVALIICIVGICTGISIKYMREGRLRLPGAQPLKREG